MVWLSCFCAPKNIACYKCPEFWIQLARNGSCFGVAVAGSRNLETTLIYAQADTEIKRKAIEKATQGICDVSVVKEDPNNLDDDTLKQLYGFQ